MAKKDEKNQEAQASQEQQGEEMLEAAPVRDADQYVLQPTSYRLPSHMAVRGELPEGRFMEEVLKGSEDEDGSTPSWEAHPKHNQPVPGIGEGDELPDTTGRAALRALKRNG